MRSLLDMVLRDDALTRGLDDPEARVLVEWLAEWTEFLAASRDGEDAARPRVAALCRVGRGLARFVKLWCHDRRHSAALQLAASENRDWPLPRPGDDPVDLMLSLTRHEEDRFCA